MALPGPGREQFSKDQDGTSLMHRSGNIQGRLAGIPFIFWLRRQNTECEGKLSSAMLSRYEEETTCETCPVGHFSW